MPIECQIEMTKKKTNSNSMTQHFSRHSKKNLYHFLSKSMDNAKFTEAVQSSFYSHIVRARMICSESMYIIIIVVFFLLNCLLYLQNGLRNGAYPAHLHSLWIVIAILAGLHLTGKSKFDSVNFVLLLLPGWESYLFFLFLPFRIEQLKHLMTN